MAAIKKGTTMNQGPPQGPYGYGPPPSQPQHYYPPQPGQPIVYVQPPQVVIAKAQFSHGKHLLVDILSCGAWIPFHILLWLLH